MTFTGEPLPLAGSLTHLLNDKQAIVLGASQGIGAAIAETLAAWGASVWLVSRQQQRLSAFADRLRQQYNVSVYPFQADVSSAEGLKRLHQNYLEHAAGQPLSILVTNTGGPPAGEFMVHEDAAWEYAGQNLLMSVVRCVRLFKPQMVAGSAITMLTSVAAKEPNAQLVLSNTYRAGLLGLVKTLSQEFGSEGIRVNAVLPGYTETERLRELATVHAARSQRRTEDVMDGFADAVPLKRLAHPQEIANVVAFLSSPLASYVSGVNLAVDGGRCHGIL